MIRLLLLGAAMSVALAAGPTLAQPSQMPTMQRQGQPAPPPGRIDQGPAGDRQTMQRDTSRDAPNARDVPMAGPPGPMTASHLIGLTVRNRSNETVGEIDDLVLDNNGRIRQVIVGVGGFLGMGERKVALNWDRLRIDQGRDIVMLNASRDQLRAMPEYRDNRRGRNGGPNRPGGQRSN